MNAPVLSKKVIPVVAVLLLCSVVLLAGQQTPPKPPRGYPNHTALKIAYFLRILKLVNLNPPIPDSVRYFKDIEYKRVGDRSLKLDICRRKDLERSAPGLIFIHGGAWRTGKKEDYLVYLIDFARRGYVTASVSYRLTREAHFPAAVEDVKCAVRWIRAHAAEYKIDPDRLAVIGGSAGGHLALMIAYSADDTTFDSDCKVANVSSRVQAVVDLYGPVDLTTDFARNNKVVVEFLGKPYHDDPALYQKASPLFYITKDDPPTLIFQGTIDKIVPVKQSDMLKKKLDEVGVINEYHRLKGWPHAMDAAVPVNKYCQYYMNEFFKKYLTR